MMNFETGNPNPTDQWSYMDPEAEAFEKYKNSGKMMNFETGNPAQMNPDAAPFEEEEYYEEDEVEVVLDEGVW